MPKTLPIVTNRNEIALEMAVWVLHDEYDYIREENYISATGLMKPLRHILLPGRIPEEKQVVPDVEDYISSALGSAIHAAAEKAWSHGNHVHALRRLGYPEQLIERVLVNPTKEQLTAKPDAIPVYVEQRSIREITVDGVTFKVGGKFDMVAEGRVTDTKSTSVWTWVFGGRDEDYKLQGSIYRWLNPDKIIEDFIRINFIFTDWSKSDVTMKNYPPRRVMHKDIPLMSLAETEDWIVNKLRQIIKHQAKSENQLPECTPDELWMSDPKYKYYADPAKAAQGGRSTKNFEPKDFNGDAEAAQTAANAMVLDKGRGIVVTVPGTPKRCGYCPAFPICTQRNKYTFE